jgi:N-acetylmuramoyl-L-alanine amidase
MPWRSSEGDLKYPVLILLSGLLFISCSADITYYEIPLEFKNSQKKKDFYDNYSKFLTGKKIFLDPGHGGEDRKNIGVQKLVVEADINLSVALALRDFLRDAGAEVFMSRDRDETVELKERSLMADRSGAEIFISIHHNAPGAGGDQSINYTSTYYHAKETDYEYEPCERDLARFVQRDMAYAMRNSGGLGSFDGTYSDYMIYPGAGFSVLRLTTIPSVLVECGFFTNPHEERRLALDEFNKIQAWGIFRGMARYFAAGVPKIEFATTIEDFKQSDVEYKFAIKDSAGINQESIRVYIDSIRIQEFKFDEQTGILTLPPTKLNDGEHFIRIIAANKNGNHAFPFHQKIVKKTKFQINQ